VSPLAQRAVGAAIPRLEALEKALGAAVYTDDMTLPGMLHGALLLSLHAHARILSIDVSRALAQPGVRAVVTGADLPDRRVGMLIRDETPFAVDRVRYAGEPVAAVAADTIEAAREALKFIEVRYELLPAVFTIDEALAPDAPVLHEDFGSYFKVLDAGAPLAANELCHCRIVHGDIEAAFARSDVIVEQTYETAAQYHAYLEPASALASVDVLGKVTVWSSTQSISRTQANVHEALGIPMAKIRAIAPRIGGGFGGKSEATVQIFAVMLSQAVRRPVRIVLSREEDMMAMRCRHPARIRVRTGATRDGKLTAREIEAWVDGGAYAEESPVIINVILFFCTGPYRFEAVRGTGHAVYTNKLRASAMRGFGNPQITFACESQMDELAAALGIDPVDFRLRNIVQVGDKWLGGQPVRSGGLAECIAIAVARSGWHEKQRGGRPAGDGRRRGLGIGLTGHISAFMGSSAFVRLLDDGTVALNTGSVDIGQGGDTVMAQMCAGMLGLDVDDVRLVACDTDASPYNSGTNASRSTHTVGRAIGAASEQVIAQLLDRAAFLLGCDRDRLEIRPGGFVAMRNGNASISFRDIALFAINAAVGGGPIIGAAAVMQNEPLDAGHTQMEGMLSFDAVGAFTFGAQVVEVEVDEATGRAQVVEAWCAHDVGRAINPLAVEGQIQGGFVQGLGYALFEELVWHDGHLRNPGFAGYKIPSSLDVPYAIHPIIIEVPDPSHPFGAKGVGEPPLIAAPAAIANAISDAVGVRMRQLPITPERLLTACREARRDVVSAKSRREP
jgi:carbon-monoxide dehydrogenase large subunit